MKTPKYVWINKRGVVVWRDADPDKLYVKNWYLRDGNLHLTPQGDERSNWLILK